MDVYFYEAFEEEAAHLKQHLPDDVTAEFTAETIQETGHDQPPARLISTRTQSRVPLGWADRIDGLLTRSTGYDHLLRYAEQVDTAPAMGYLPLYCNRACAEQALMLTLALLRRLPRQIRQFHDFHRDGLTGREAMNKTMLIVGVGQIGHALYQLAGAIGMHPLGVDIDPRHDDVTYVDFNETLPKADVIACTMNLTEHNRGYFNTRVLERVKPGAVFVNISRGELSPSSDLLDALEAGQLSGVGLDVYDHEAELAIALRRGENHVADKQVRAARQLALRDDVIATPHNAFNTIEAVDRKAEHSIRQVVHFLQQGHFLWPVPGTSN